MLTRTPRPLSDRAMGLCRPSCECGNNAFRQSEHAAHAALPRPGKGVCSSRDGLVALHGAPGREPCLVHERQRERRPQLDREAVKCRWQSGLFKLGNLLPVAQRLLNAILQRLQPGARVAVASVDQSAHPGRPSSVGPPTEKLAGDQIIPYFQVLGGSAAASSWASMEGTTATSTSTSRAAVLSLHMLASGKAMRSSCRRSSSS